MAESDRSEYPGILTKVHPGHAVDILNDRVRQAGRLNTAIADWLQERRLLEEQYASGLRRLARKNLEDADLGIFSVPWTAITTSMDTSADSHSSLAHKIQTDVEQPLRDFVTSNRELQAMTTIQGNLGSLAKDIERAQQQTEKLQGKGERAEANKVANASSDLDNARVQWDSQAPYVFESLQALDETRVNQMRDHLTQLQTLELDQVEKNRAAAEQCLNILLNVETRDEIKTFALKAVSQKPPPAPRSKRQSFMPSLPTGASSTPSRGAQSSNALTTIQSNTDESINQASASNTPEPTKKSAFKGLKRIGTVMSRRSNKQPVTTLPSTAESPERKTKSSPFGRLGRNKDSYSGSLEPPQDDGSSRRPSEFRRGSEILEPPESRHSAATFSRVPQLDPMPHVNGTSSLMPPGASLYANGNHQGDLADMEPPKLAQPEAPSLPTFVESPSVPEPRRDNDGFSVPPQSLDPISQAEADAAAAGERAEPQFNVNIRSAPIQEEGADVALATMANKLQAPPPTSTRRAGTVRGRRDNRNSAIISTYGAPSQPSPEPIAISTPSPSERPIDPVPPPPVQAPTPVIQPPPTEPASNILAQSASSAFISPGAAPTFSPFNPGPDPSSPVRPSSRTAALGPEHTGDSQSIRSGRSTASQGTKHPDLHSPGLNSSIVETVSAKFESGKPVSSTLIGEIALAYNPTDISSSFGHETIRLENFASLDKVAPNPAFVTTIPNKEYEYSVNLGSITRTQIAFKYQILHTDDANNHIPLVIAPAYKIQGTQAMAIVSYSLAPSFLLHGKASITLSNVMIALTLEGAKATGCQSKPVGTFNRDRNLIFWPLGDITLRAGAEPEKLLARFTTETEAAGGSVEAKWELSGENAQGVGSPLSISMSGQADGAADPFADESAGAAGSNWKSVPLLKKLAAGSYVAK